MMASIFSRRTVRIKAMQSLYAHHHQDGSNPQSEADDFYFVQHAFSEDMEALKEIHVQFLHALLFWADLDQKNIKNALRTPRRHLNDSSWIKKLRSHPTFVELQAKYPSFWDPNLLAIWYHETIHKLPFLRSYRFHTAVSSAMELTLIKTLFTKVILAQEGIRIYAQQKIVDWEPYEDGFSSYIHCFIKQVHQSDPAAFDLHTTFDFHTEIFFYSQLVEATLNHLVGTNREIDRTAQNWEKGRIFILDRVLLQMALTEVKHLKSIPKAVAINEYVDIAKAYSTAKSYRFINGMLDVLLPNEMPSAY